MCPKLFILKEFYFLILESNVRSHHKYSHTRRSSNSLAHNLAQYARHVDTLTVWMEDIPPQLHHVLVTDFG